MMRQTEERLALGPQLQGDSGHVFTTVEGELVFIRTTSRRCSLDGRSAGPHPGHCEGSTRV